jgi:hypothetical protein
VLTRGVTMISTKRMLLGTAAATISVAAGAGMEARAADAMLKKAPPVQYVKICDMYGAGFFQIPGTSLCLQIRGSLQLDTSFQPRQDMLIVTHSGSGSFTAGAQTFIPAGGQDNWGYEFNTKPKLDMRNETSYGTQRTFVELKGAIDAGLFNDPGGFPGPTPKEANTFSIYRAYVQWAGWTFGEADSVFSTGGFKDGDIQNVITGEKESGFLLSYTWTPSGPGQPPKKGSAPVPDGWSVTVAAESPTKNTPKAFFGQSVNDLQLVIGGVTQTVNAAAGPLAWPDAVVRIHYEADPSGKDPQFNDQWGIGAFQLSGVLHQIDFISTGGSGGVFPSPLTCPLPSAGNCAVGTGQVQMSTGYAVGADMKIFTPMFGGAKLGTISGADADSLWFEAVYGVGAIQFVGIGGQNGNLQSGDAYYMGGLERDDADVRLVNNGNGTFGFDKESAFSFNVQYHHILTDCTDPVNCWRMNLEYNYAKVTPGSVTQLTDWTLGGLGVATKNSFTVNFIWGESRTGQMKPTMGEHSFEFQYNAITQALPGNCNGGLSACVAQTALPVGIKQNPSSWVARYTWTRGW